MMKQLLYNMLFATCIFFLQQSLHAQWANNPAAPLIVCNAEGSQSEPVALTDGSDGFFVFWLDSRDGKVAAYGQHLDQEGNALWEPNGKAIVDYDEANVSKLGAVMNGEGNIIISWERYLTGYADTLYAQKLNADGDALWDQDIAVAGTNLGMGGSFWGPVNHSITASGDDVLFGMIMTGYGYNFVNFNKLTADGELPWGYNGTNIPSVLSAAEPKIYADGLGGGYVGWSYYGDFMRRFDDEGNLLWVANTKINGCTNGTGGTYAGMPYFLLQQNGDDGFVAAWSSASDDIYAAEIDTAGDFVWDDTCHMIYGDEYVQEQIAFSRSGDDYYVSWMDSRPDAGGLYMQKFNGAGENQWGSELYVEDASFYIPVIKSTTTGEGDIAIFYQAAGGFYAQKVHADASTEWVEPLKVMDLQPFYGNYEICPSGENNVVGFAQAGGVGGYDIFAFNLNFVSGDTLTQDTTTTSVELLTDGFMIYPNPADDQLIIHAPAGFAGGQVELLSLSGQRVFTGVITENNTIDCSPLSEGLYFVMLTSASQRIVQRVVVHHKLQ